MERACILSEDVSLCACIYVKEIFLGVRKRGLTSFSIVQPNSNMAEGALNPLFERIELTEFPITPHKHVAVSVVMGHKYS